MSTFKTIGTGGIAITTTGIAKSLVSGSTLCNRVDIQAKSANTGKVYIGSFNVANDASNGIELNAGDVYSIEIITDLFPIFVNGTSGDGVTFVYWIGERN